MCSRKPVFFTRWSNRKYVRPDSVVSKAKSVLDSVNSTIPSNTARPARNIPASGSNGENARASRSGLMKLRQGGDTADVIGELLDEIGVQVVQRGAHFRSVFLVHAKDNGLCEAVGLFQEIGEVLRDGFSPFEQGDFPLEIRRAIDSIRDATTVAVQVFRAWTPARCVPLRHNPMDAVGRQEAIVNALPEAVSVNRVAEIDIGVAVFVAQRRGRHAELIGGLEVFQDFAPVGIFLGAAAVAFVHDN